MKQFLAPERTFFLNFAACHETQDSSKFWRINNYKWGAFEEEGTRRARRFGESFFSKILKTRKVFIINSNKNCEPSKFDYLPRHLIKCLIWQIVCDTYKSNAMREKSHLSKSFLKAIFWQMWKKQFETKLIPVPLINGCQHEKGQKPWETAGGLKWNWSTYFRRPRDKTEHTLGRQMA